MLKKIIFICLLLSMILSCASYRHIALYDCKGDLVYENDGYIKIEPDYKSPTFNVKVKEETGEIITFFGDISGYIE